jgi:glycine cleavage system regulatory protein
LLADRGVNIVDMKTQRILSPESGTPLFEMDMDINVPKTISEQGLRDDLHRLGNELVIDLVLKKVI